MSIYYRKSHLSIEIVNRHQIIGNYMCKQNNAFAKNLWLQIIRGSYTQFAEHSYKMGELKTSQVSYQHQYSEMTLLINGLPFIDGSITNEVDNNSANHSSSNTLQLYKLQLCLVNAQKENNSLQVPSFNDTLDKP